uniref:DNA cytosine methyltransferase n=1 Tax=Amycolatopsis sp. cmx-4-54 TaxID=2790936 RepID=UPI00397906CB
MNYYNEYDPVAAERLRLLIDAGLIPMGIVDTRSILDVRPQDLRGFTQCHFFAGIAGWPLALRLAGLPDDLPLWTGSPPCQPFSVAGAGLGARDSRHLAPALLDLIAECRPPMLFGEQVAAAVKKDHWLDALLIELEEEGYACAAHVLPAAGVGAPHKRDRLFFAAFRLDDTE